MDQITRAILGLKKLQWLLKADSFGQPEAMWLFFFFFLWRSGGGGGGDGGGGGITSSRNVPMSVFHLFLNSSLCATVSFFFFHATIADNYEINDNAVSVMSLIL